MFQVVFHDVNGLTEKLFPIVEAMQKHFSAGSGAYYSDAIFFLSVAMHRIMPTGELGCFSERSYYIDSNRSTIVRKEESIMMSLSGINNMTENEKKQHCWTLF